MAEYFANRFRLLCPNKSIWLYSGYEWNQIFTNEENEPFQYEKEFMFMAKRQAILKQCTVMVDGKYIDSQRDITLKWCGSKNQHIIDVQQSIKKGEIVLWKC